MDPNDTNITDAWRDTLQDTGKLLQQCLIQHYAILLENTDTIIASLQALILDQEFTTEQVERLNTLETKLLHTRTHKLNAQQQTPQQPATPETTATPPVNTQEHTENTEDHTENTEKHTEDRQEQDTRIRTHTRRNFYRQERHPGPYHHRKVLLPTPTYQDTWRQQRPPLLSTQYSPSRQQQQWGPLPQPTLTHRIPLMNIYPPSLVPNYT